MPHLVILYSANLDTGSDMTALCRSLCDTLLVQQDPEGKNVFPKGGTRVLAYPAPHFAVADDGSASRAAGGSGEYGFVYLNLRMAPGRSQEIKQQVGDAVLLCAKAHFAPLFETRHLGLTLHIDEAMPAYEGKQNNIVSLFV